MRGSSGIKLIAVILISLSLNCKSDWLRSTGNDESTKYSDLSQINKENLKNLELAWSYHSKDFGNVESTPIYTNGKLIFPSKNGGVIALNAANGLEIWRKQLNGEIAKRGLAAYGSDIFLPTSNGILVLNSSDGSINESIGNHGHFGKETSFLPPIIYEKNKIKSLICANYSSIEKFDLKTGRKIWQLKLEKDNVTARLWSGLSYDKSSDQIFVVTANPVGIIDENIGDGGYSSSLISINAQTGKVNWQIQDIKHDIWDLDVVGAPIVADIPIEGKLRATIIAVTKSGKILFADRISGDLIFPAKYITKYLANTKREMKYLSMELPEHFGKTSYELEKDTSELTKDNIAYIRHKTRNASFDSFAQTTINRDVVMFGLHGGAEWPGAALNKNKNQLIVPSNNNPWILRVRNFDLNSSISEHQFKSDKIYNQKCMICHGVDGNGWSQNEFEGGHYVAPLINISNIRPKKTLTNIDSFNYIHQYISTDDEFNLNESFLKKEHDKKIKKFVRKCFFLPKSLKNNLTEYLKNDFLKSHQKDHQDKVISAILNIRKITEEDLLSLYKLFKKIDNDIKSRGDLGIKQEWQLLLGKDNLPASNPPWGMITSIDLSTGKTMWKVPFGTIKSGRKTINGDINFGGVLSLNDLIIAGGTRDDEVRILDAHNGKLLWSQKFDSSLSSPPMTYMDSGCQYVVFPLTGGMFYGFKQSDLTVAYKLKSCNRN